MNNLEQTFFSPLSKEYCAYFYYLTVFAFIFLVLAIGQALYAVVEGDVNVFSAILALFGPFLLYFNNRLLYSMCAGLK